MGVAEAAARGGVRGKGEGESFPLREEAEVVFLWKRLGNRFSFFVG